MQSHKTFSQRVSAFLFDHIWEILLLIFLVLIAYIYTLNYELVSDDIEAITNNKRIGDIMFALTSVRSSLWQLLHFFSYKIGGQTPGVYRIINISAHLFNVILVYVLVNKLSRRNIALATAAIFAVHPVMIEAVTWISGGAYALYTTFLLASFITFIYSETEKKTSLTVMSLLFFVLAILTSERTVVFPLLLIVYSFVFQKKINWSRILPFIIVALVAGSVFAVHIGPRLYTVKKSLTQNATAGDNYILTPISITSYLHLLYWPDNLTLYHADPFTDEQYIGMVMVTLVFLALYIFLFFRERKLFFWFSFYLIILVPMITPLRIASTVAERYIYMASIGLIFITVYTVWYYTARKNQSTIFNIIMIGVVSALLVRTTLRNQDWSTRETFWRTTVQSSPVSYQSHYNYALILRSKGKYAEAVDEFNKTILLKTDYSQAYFDLALTLQKMNKIAAAVEAYKKSVAYDPTASGAWNNLANLYFRYGKYPEAAQYMLNAVANSPNEPDFRTNLGIIYLEMGQKDKAREAFTSALQLDPNYAKAKEGLRQSQ